jgi:hypothetical protein
LSATHPFDHLRLNSSKPAIFALTLSPLSEPRLRRLDNRHPLLQIESMSLSNGVLTIAGRTFRSRLILGTGKFSSPESMRDALAASGTEIVTVALRRADLTGRKDPFANILEFVDPTKYLLLPNTSGAMNAEEAVRLASWQWRQAFPNG